MPGELSGDTAFPCQQDPLPAKAVTAAKGERGTDPVEHGVPAPEGPEEKPPLPLDVAVVVETYSGQFPNTPDQTPDADLAVSPDHVVVISNFTILVMRRGDPSTAVNRWLMGYHTVSSPPIPQFWDATLGVNDNFVIDPEVYWDEVSGRFFLVASVGASPQQPSHPLPLGNLLVAVSKTSDPSTASGTATDAWWQYFMNVPFQSSSGDYIDNPAFAIRGDAMALGYDYAAIARSHLLTLRTADLLGGPQVSPKTWVNRVDFMNDRRTLALTVHRNASALDDTIYALQSCAHPQACASGNSLTVHAFVNPLSVAAMGDPPFTHVTHTIPLGATYLTPASPPTGFAGSYSVFGPRFWHCSWYNHSVWAVHEVRASGGGTTRPWWYEVALNGFPMNPTSPPTITQSGELTPVSGESWFSPAISVDANQNAGIFWAATSPTMPIGLRRAFRQASDPSGTFQTITAVASSATYLGIAKIDDSSIVADPADPGLFWFTGVTKSAAHPGVNSWDQWLGCFQIP